MVVKYIVILFLATLVVPIVEIGERQSLLGVTCCGHCWILPSVTLLTPSGHSQNYFLAVSSIPEVYFYPPLDLIPNPFEKVAKEVVRCQKLLKTHSEALSIRIQIFVFIKINRPCLVFYSTLCATPHSFPTQIVYYFSFDIFFHNDLG